MTDAPSRPHPNRPAELSFVVPQTDEHLTLKLDLTMGQYRHPRMGYLICSMPNRTFANPNETSAGSPVCTQAAGRGTSHVGLGSCWLHGGTLEGAIKGVQMPGTRMRSENARRAAMDLLTLAVPIEVDPIDALLGLVHESAGNVLFLGAQCAKLGLDVVGDVYSLSRDGEPIATSEDARAIVKLYNDERDRLARVSKLALDAGIEARRLKLEEDQAVMVATVVRVAVMKLGLEIDIQMQLLSAIAQEFRTIDVTPDDSRITGGSVQ